MESLSLPEIELSILTLRGQRVTIANTNLWTAGGVASPVPFYWSTAGYGVLGLHLAYSFAATGARWNAWARADNLLDRTYAGSLIVNDGNGRYFEPAAGRRIVLGLRAQF